jgi:hypothetical protein
VSRINEAGVAGEPSAKRSAAIEFFCAGIYGDLLADDGGGAGGGAINDRCSGDIEPFSDSSVLAVEWDELFGFERATLGFEGSRISPRAWAGMFVVEPFFPLRGLVMGDCWTFRAPRPFCGGFLPVLERMVVLGGAELESRFISTGELVVFECIRSKVKVWSLCAWRAGELRGLKYAPGTVYSGMLKCASRGVTAGDTSGVKAIYALSVRHDLAHGMRLTSWSLCIRNLSYMACCCGSECG